MGHSVRRAVLQLDKSGQRPRWYSPYAQTPPLPPPRGRRLAARVDRLRSRSRARSRGARPAHCRRRRHVRGLPQPAPPGWTARSCQAAPGRGTALCGHRANALGRHRSDHRRSAHVSGRRLGGKIPHDRPDQPRCTGPPAHAELSHDGGRSARGGSRYPRGSRSGIHRLDSRSRCSCCSARGSARSCSAPTSPAH